MPIINCPSCSKKLKVAEQAVGRKVRCSCGHLFLAASPQETNVNPSPSSRGHTSPNTKSATRSITTRCACGKSLRVSESSIGKLVKCPCGRKFTVSESIDLPDDLPVSTLPTWKPSDNNQHAWVAAPLTPSNRPNSVAPQNDGPQKVRKGDPRSQAVEMLSKAHHDLEDQEKHSGGISFTNAGVGGGFLMIVGGAIWLVLGIEQQQSIYYGAVGLIIGGTISIITGVIRG